MAMISVTNAMELYSSEQHRSPLLIDAIATPHLSRAAAKTPLIKGGHNPPKIVSKE